ncbi:hypothetical protein WN51_12716 [Melipona quadrifasciata]|uniref:Uncharacterized protein n=1 Tax=Melipona quadrifasciata TaxID=166423 RepID=A0A0N0BGN1_9HYME|nr:hypothetical protein WN51_12716 [Melipona quadrifasciata]
MFVIGGSRHLPVNANGGFMLQLNRKLHMKMAYAQSEILSIVSPQLDLSRLLLIRSKLPNVACYLKRLARLKNGGESESEREGIGGTPEVSEIMEGMLNRTMLEISGVSINEQNVPGGRGSVDWPENRVIETRWYETASDLSNPEEPSTSTANTNDDTNESPVIAATSQIEPAQTISVTTTEAMTTNGIFMSVLNRDTALAENIMLFREALSSHIGSQAERLREIRDDPLVYIQSEDRHELYLGGTANGESGFSGSSTIRSEIGSVAETDNRSREVRNQRIGQDPTPQFFDTLLDIDRIVTRKSIRRNDDSSSIY